MRIYGLTGVHLSTAVATLALSFAATTRAQQHNFYVTGATEALLGQGEPHYKNVRLYEMDSSDRVVRSREIAAGGYADEGTGAYTGMLAGDSKTIVLVGGVQLNQSTLILVSAPNLKIQGRMDIPLSRMPTDPFGNPIHCTDHIFVNPATGLTYFSCALGPGSYKHLVVDPFHRRVVSLGPQLRAASYFLYDPKNQWTYLVGSFDSSIFPIMDSDGRIIGRIAEFVSGKNIPSDPCLSRAQDAALLPNGNLVLLAPGWPRSVVCLYDTTTRKVIRSWTEDRTYMGINMPHAAPKPFYYTISNVPVPSADGLRLFGFEESNSAVNPPATDGILWDAKTLQVLRRWKLPEPQGYNCSTEGVGAGLIACFTPAPDGRGMWYFGRSGKIYRLDGHTGALLGEVKLPFHLISLIREP